MTDIPIIFSAAMVRALLDGRKTMTRRLAWRPARKGEATGEGSRLSYIASTETGVGTVTAHDRPSPWQRAKAGDRLWVRENFNPRYFDGGKPAYGADWTGESADCVPRPKWTPCIHMPRILSRITLIVTATKIERLQVICHNDIKAEGIFQWEGVGLNGGPLWHFLPKATRSEDVHLGCVSAMAAWQHLWTCVNGHASWDANPEVVAVSFRVIKANIDVSESRAA